MNDLTRRDFFATAGSGLFVFFQETERPPMRMAYPTDFNAYLRIGADARVTCLVGKVELGQGAMTSLAQLVAEELDVALESVDMEMGDTDLCPWDMGTFGSMNIWMFGPVLRAAAAEARAVLLQMAGERFGAPASQLQVKGGVVAWQAKRVSYAKLVEGKQIERHVPKAPLKPVKTFTVVGQSPQRKDGLDKVTGKAKYTGDMLIPGTLHARILRPPAHGATLKQAVTSAAEKATGARVVRDGELVAVLHERPDVAEKALALIKAEFERPQPAVDDKTIFDHLLKTAPQPRVVSQGGNLADGEKLAATRLEMTYRNSYVAHAAMETHSAVVKIEGGQATVWASTQAPFSVKSQVAKVLGLAEENVHVITPFVGGGFGGKSEAPQAAEAARLAKIVGRPVQVVWDRAEEFFYDPFRPAAVIKIRAGVSAAAKIAFWDYSVVGAGERGSEPFYDVAHHRAVSAGGWQGGNPVGMHPFAVGPWRAPSANSNVFARESHIDALASQAGIDALEFRRGNLTNKRVLRVLDAAAQQFGWKPARAPSGRGVGLACATYSGTAVAAMAEAAVDKTTGHVEVKRVVLAQDQGVTVSPDGTRQQMEGSITMGLGYALAEEVRFQGGQVLDRNFDTYSLPRFSWVPKIETILIDNPDLAAQSCGEPPIVNMGAVIANAIFDAVGARLVQLPMTPARILEALRWV